MKKAYRKIMIVDDSYQNLKLLGNMLEQYGYEVYSFDNGKSAYNAAKKNRPDLVLMDICMPEMNGYELCGLFKQNKELNDIPVIFLSALNSIEDKVLAFKNGGVDYITKPFNFEEVQARIATHLKIVEMKNILEKENNRLEQMVEERTKELREAYLRLKKSDEIKKEILKRSSAEIKGVWSSIGKVFETVFKNKNRAEYVEIEKNRNKLEDLIRDTEILNKIEFYQEKPTVEKISVLNVIRELEKEGVEIEIHKKDGIEDGEVNGNSELIKRAFEITAKIAKSYTKERKVKLQYNSEAEYIYLSFILEDFFVYNEDIYDFLSMKQNSRDSGNTISNILAHKIITLFNGKIYFERAGKNIALLTIVLIKSGDGIDEQDYDNR